MKAFMDQDFILRTDTARELYHSFAAQVPVLDYHCHINPQEIAEDRQFENITQVWLGGDHYKWRQMRSNGVDEYYITGGAPDREKFQKWAETLDKAIAEDKSFDVQVLPAWRPDKAMNLEKPDYADYLKKLGEAAGVEIKSFGDLKEALKKRLAFFAELGCRVSDHALEYVMYVPASEEELEAIFSKRLSGEAVTREEELKFKTGFMLFVGAEYTRLGWAMQLHYGCKRDNNTGMYQKLGPDTGYDCINNYAPSNQMADFLNALNEAKALPKTIIYSLNPNDDEAIGTILGCFQDSAAVGKIQQGPAWWFNDNKTGMQKQMTSLANLGLLGNFIGMLTDSRSFLSYPRHEYFRRILCDLLGTWVEDGEYPKDMKKLEAIVKGISYNNAIRYFGFALEAK